jgi:hypothetical protein
MKRNPRKDKYIRQYVLGTHEPENEEEFEERLLTDEKLLEELSIVEDEVVNDYFSGALSESEREKFEDRFLSTAAGQQELEFVKTSRNYFANLSASEKRTPLPRSWKRFLPAFLRGESPIWRVSFATAIIILVSVGLIAVLRNRSNEGADVFSATLVPGQTKSIGSQQMNVIEVPAGTGLIKLQLAIGETNAQNYRASIFTDTGEEIFSKEYLAVESTTTGSFVSVNVPARLLNRGDYRLKLTSRTSANLSEEIAAYSFRVIRR